MDNQRPNRIRAEVATSTKGVMTWNVTVEVTDLDESAESWTLRRNTALDQVGLMVDALREAYGQGDVVKPASDG